MEIVTERNLQQLVQGRSYVEFDRRTIVELQGEDARSFLHRFCTNDIERLQPGEGCEAFLTTVQGKTLGHLLVCIEANSVILETVPAQADTIISHLDRYVFNERVTLTDRSSEWRQWLLVGGGWHERLSRVTQLPSHGTGHWLRDQFGGVEVRLIAAPYTASPCVILRADRGAEHAVQAGFEALEATKCHNSVFEWRRIEAGFPWFGQDFDQANLPQELDRDEMAISFTKGCYLGQETVARLDSLGHVNRLLRGLVIEQPTSLVEGCVLQLGDREVGQLTSLAHGDRHSIGLAILRRNAAAPGTELAVQGSQATVCKFPIQATR